MILPPFVTINTVRERLQTIFPEGTPQRTYCVCDAAAAAVFTMLYVGAIQGANVWVAPKQIVRMSDEQALRSSDESRLAYAANSVKPGFLPIGKVWYQENSREQIRDESIRQGLIVNNAVVERKDLPTTSSLPRYSLQAEFAALFDPSLSADSLEKASLSWQGKHLSATARARTLLARKGAATTEEGVLVTFPNGETRRMAPGPSSYISKAVIEDFAKRFLAQPAVLWVSESGAKIVARDDELAKKLNLKITADRNLPDIILVDLGKSGRDDFLLVFVEVVATDGPITAERKEALLGIATEAGFPAERVSFVTAYVDRRHPSFKKTVPELAWKTFAWFATEPTQILALYDESDQSRLLRDLVR